MGDEAPGLTLFVRRLNGATEEVSAPADGTVQDIIDQITAAGARPPRLVYQGQRLVGATPLADAGLSAEAVLEEEVCGFEVGQKLEAVDRKTPRYICVATITEIADGGERVNIHFDGWTARYDYWTEVDTDDIAPIGTCKRNNYELKAPKAEGWYGWAPYLQRCGAEAAPEAAFRRSDGYFARAFAEWDVQQPGRSTGSYSERSEMPPDYLSRPPPPDADQALRALRAGPLGVTPSVPVPSSAASRMQTRAIPPARTPPVVQRPATAPDFQVGMRLEAVDPKTPGYICAAHVAQTRPPAGPGHWQQLLISFDGWTSNYDYWCMAEDDRIAPAGTCQAINYKLQPPRGAAAWIGWAAYTRSQGQPTAPAGCFARTSGFFSTCARRAGWQYSESPPGAAPAPRGGGGGGGGGASGGGGGGARGGGGYRGRPG